MGRRSLVAVVTALAVLVAAPLAAGNPFQPKKRIRPADQALARSVVLRRADLPPGSWTGQRSSSDATSPTCPGLRLDNSDVTETGHADGLEFQEQRTDSIVSSEVGVFASAAEAKTFFGRLDQPRVGRCLGVALASGLPKSAKPRILSARKVALARVTQEAGAFRIVASFDVSGRRLRLYLDVALLRHGRGVAAVIAGGLLRPFPQFRSLATLVAHRMARA